MGDTSDQVIQLLEQGRIDLAITRRNAATDSECTERNSSPISVSITNRPNMLPPRLRR